MIYGAYTCCIKRRNDTLFFASNSEMHCVYISKYGASSSFLEHLDYLKQAGIEIFFSDESVCEYITLGKVFFKKTFAENIVMLPNDQYLRFKNGEMQISDKSITGIDGESHIGSPEKFFGDLAYAIEKVKVSSALTGGYDSRMVVAMLYKRVPLKLYYSTNNPEDTEARVSKAVARKLNIPHSIYHTDKPELTDDRIRCLISDTDGMMPVDLDSSFRIRNFKAKLENEGYELSLTGDGGVLHKDWEWMQDLPFYHKKRTNLRRFYHQRIAMNTNILNIGPRLKNIYSSQEDRFVRLMEPYKKDINTRSYDSLYHYVSSSQCLGYNCDSAGFVSYAPLWELDLVRNSYHLPRSQRFFYNFLRRMTTKANPEIAKIPTNYGTTESSEVKYLFRDVFFQLADYARKAIRLFGRILFHKTFVKERNVDWTLEGDLRNLPAAARAVEFGQKYGLLSDKANLDSVSYTVLTRLVHLYLLSKDYDIAFLQFSADADHR